MSDPRIVNEREVDAEPIRPDADGCDRKQLSSKTGAENLGYSIYVLEPEATSWPYHFHSANEEAIFVLSGRGEVRYDDGTKPVQSGDCIAFPTGEEGAHRIANTGENPLRYLCFSTMKEPDVTVYPEAEMIGIFAGSPPGGNKEDRTLHTYLDATAEIDYWDHAD